LCGQPNIVQLEEVILLGNQFSHALVFRQYSPARKFVPHDEEELRRFMYQILLAVQQCHTKKIIHRDINLNNVLFTRNPQLLVLLTDFDIALEQREATTNDCSGTPGHIAPEVFYGNKASCSSDMWQVGILFLELVHGGCPIPKENKEVGAFFSAYEKRMSSVFDNAQISALLADLLVKLTCFNPGDRLSVSQALQHPYFGETTNQTTKDQVMFDNLEF